MELLLDICDLFLNERNDGPLVYTIKKQLAYINNLKCDIQKILLFPIGGRILVQFSI